MLELRPSCEHCNTALPPASTQVVICSFECTFCTACASNVLGGICPNCGGNFTARPIRPAHAKAGVSHLGQYPARTEPKYRPADLVRHAELVARLKDVPPEMR